MSVSPLTLRRWQNFKANRRGWWSLWIFMALFVLTMAAELIANERPLILEYQNDYYFPVLRTYSEQTFGGDFETEAVYRDPYVQELIAKGDGWMLWPPIRYDYTTINFNLATPAPSPPDTENWLGTDDQGRDVLARLIYGFRISVLFGLCLTLFSAAIGIFAGALQGYFGGKVDLFFQRFIEIWHGLPPLLSRISGGFWA
jgi:microcin C transport system permease protein